MVAPQRRTIAGGGTNGLSATHSRCDRRMSILRQPSVPAVINRCWVGTIVPTHATWGSDMAKSQEFALPDPAELQGGDARGAEPAESAAGTSVGEVLARNHDRLMQIEAVVMVGEGED